MPAAAYPGRSSSDAAAGPVLAPIALPIQLPAPAARPPPERVIPADTVVTTQDGQRFFTQAEARLAPSGHAAVPIVAELPGGAGNVPAGAIDRLADPAADGPDLRIENRLPTYRGTDRQDQYVAPEDREALQRALEERAAAERPARLFHEAGTEFVVLPATAAWTLEEYFDFAADQRADRLTGRAVVRARVLGVPARALEERAGSTWRQQLPGGLASVGQPQLAGAPTTQEQTDAYLVISLPVTGQVAPQLDATALAAQFRGQSADAIGARLTSLPGVHDSPRVEMWPTWAPAALRVDVQVTPAK